MSVSERTISAADPRVAIVLVLSTLAAAAAVALQLPAPVRAPIVIWFVVVCPGLALIRPFRVGPPFVELTIAIGLSLSIDGIVAAIFLYAGRWSPEGALAILCVLTLVAVGGEWLASRRRPSVDAPARNPDNSTRD